MAKKYLDDSGLLYFWQQLKTKFAGVDDVPDPSATAPIMDGTATVGTSTDYARADHIHPSDTSKVDVEAGKGLSENDFTTALKDKLDGIASGAEVNVQADWDETDTTSDAYIQNKPTIPSGVVVDSALSTVSENPVQNKVITGALNNKVDTSDKGVANGVAPLNSSGIIDNQYLPSYIDDVIEAYPISGATELSAGWLSLTSGGSALTPETGKIYIILAASTSYAVNTQFRWGGTTYVELSDGNISAITNGEIDTILAS